MDKNESQMDFFGSVCVCFSLSNLPIIYHDSISIHTIIEPYIAHPHATRARKKRLYRMLHSYQCIALVCGFRLLLKCTATQFWVRWERENGQFACWPCALPQRRQIHTYCCASHTVNYRVPGPMDVFFSAIRDDTVSVDMRLTIVGRHWWAPNVSPTACSVSSWWNNTHTHTQSTKHTDRTIYYSIHHPPGNRDDLQFRNIQSIIRLIKL